MAKNDFVYKNDFVIFVLANPIEDSLKIGFFTAAGKEMDHCQKYWILNFELELICNLERVTE